MEAAPDMEEAFYNVVLRLARSSNEREIKVGLRNAVAGQILDGLHSGDIVIRYPSSGLSDGARMRTN
jgi:hypothetical protein